MDVQVAVKLDAARPSASSDVPAIAPQPGGSKPGGSGTPNGIKSSPPVITMDIDDPNGGSNDNGAKSDSEAETIVLPGKDGHSPSKIRKAIKHEDRSDDEEMKDAPAINEKVAEGDGSNGGGRGKDDVEMESESTATSLLGKRKRPKHGNGITNGNGTAKDDTTHHGNSSGLSSVPTSPVATTRSSLSKPAASDSEVSKSPSPSPRSHSNSRSSVREKAKSVDRVLSRGKAFDSADEDEGESRKSRFDSQRGSGSGANHKITKRDIDADSNPQKHTRSVSPHSRGHRRSISTQLPSKTSRGLSHKKKRIPAPLQSTEYHSDDSSASGTSHQRSSRVRHLAAPITGDSAISPAKMAPHKKHVNPSGQTHLAVACSRGKLDQVKQRYDERPEDLNVPDNALNTPLHVSSLHDFVDIVQFLLNTGHCELDCQNVDKDTPLHDAVDNKNVDVVKLLLDAGANPNKANKSGNEPLDLLNQYEHDDDDDEEILEMVKNMRKAIIAAKKKFTSMVSRDSEGAQDNISNPKGSPRQTPPIETYNTQAHTKARGARAVKTAHGFLYQSLDLNELRKAARDGDAETVTRVINVNPEINDPKTLWNAARGGHDSVINLLFGLCPGYDPDPHVETSPPDQSTPILAAIGKDHHLEVINLLLQNPKFNPTKRIRGQTYIEIARKRAGPRWQEEELLLRKAVENYPKTHKSPPGKVRSPGLRRDGRDGDMDARKTTRSDEQLRSHKRAPSGPETSNIQHRKSSSTSQSKAGVKRGPGRPRKEESVASSALSDREASPPPPPKLKSQSRKSESDIAVVSENEPHRKRKLVSRKDLNAGKESSTVEKQRRASTTSTASGLSVKDKKERTNNEPRADKSEGRASSGIPRSSRDSHGEKDSTSDRLNLPVLPSKEDRARSSKREDSKDRLSAIRGESPVKRHRKSETPPRSSIHESTAERTGEAPSKKRKLGMDSPVHKDTPSSSPEDRSTTAKSMLSRENSARNGSDAKLKAPRPPKHGDSLDVSKDPSSSDKSSPNRRRSASGPSDPPAKRSKISTDRGPKEASEKSKSSRCEDEEAAKEAHIRQKQGEEEANRLKEVEELKRKADEERAEEAKKIRLAQEQADREAEEKKAQEEREKLELQRKVEFAARQQALEDEKRRYEEQEKRKKEELDRRHALRIEQARIERIRIDKEKTAERLSKLPLLLRWFDQVPDPKTAETVKLFKKIIGYRFDTINPQAVGHTAGREQWMLNTHAAILLGEKDLQLSRYTAWERIHLSLPQKRGVWSTTNGLYSLMDGRLTSLRKQFPKNGQTMDEIVDRNRALFLDLDLFFIKVTEFMFVVQSFPHLRGIELEVAYKELQIPQTGLELGRQFNEMRWKQDFPGQAWSPLPTYYINGDQARQGEVKLTLVSKEPPPTDRVPRREGITRVYPHEADYAETCKKQGLYHLIPGCQTSPRSETHPPAQLQSVNHVEHVNGITPPMSDKSINGGSPHRSSISEHAVAVSLTNGTNYLDVSPMDTS